MHNRLFLTALPFVLGAILGGLGASPLIASLVLLIAFLLFLGFFRKLPKYLILIAAIFFLIGNIYYSLDDFKYHSKVDMLAGADSFLGMIVSTPRRGEFKQSVKLKSDQGIRIIATLPPYPEFHYGDLVALAGKVELPPRDSYGNYLAKERIAGTMFYPEALVLDNVGNFFWRNLYGLKNAMEEMFGKLFNSSQSAFLSGILLGEKDGFSKDFLDKLSQSGTIHLTALSGQNMTIIAFIAVMVFKYVFIGRRKLIFLSSLTTISLFVAMTGFDVSAIRASLMGGLSSLANQLGRAYDSANAILFAAFILTIFNPKVPVFDLGFQLSFFATASIIYFAPVIKRLKFFQISGFLGWRDVAAITIAAQIGVAPITIFYFNNFSFTALPANIAILIIIPFLMILGFAILVFGAIWAPFASILAYPASFLIDYSSKVVDIFYRFKIPFNPEISIFFAIIYYSALAWVCFRFRPKTAKFT